MNIEHTELDPLLIPEGTVEPTRDENYKEFNDALTVQMTKEINAEILEQVSKEVDKEREQLTGVEQMTKEINAEILDRLLSKGDAAIDRNEQLIARAAEIANSPGFDWTKVPVSRPSQKQAKARKSKARQQRNARKHNRKRK